jgi:hypothetical protein
MVRLPQKQAQLGVGYILAAIAFSQSFFQHGKLKILVFDRFDLILCVGREIKKLP